MSLVTSLAQRKGHYSEAFLIADNEQCVVRVEPTPLEYWLATSDAADNALLSDTRQKFPDLSLPEALHFLATHFPSGSQGTKQLPAQLKPEPGKKEA